MSKRIGELRLDVQTLEELQDERPVVRLDRAEVSSLQLHFGFVAERLIAEVVVAAMVLMAGLVMVRSVILWLFYGGTMEVHVAAVVVLAPLGSYVLARSLRRGWSVVATLQDGRKRRVVLGRDDELAAQFSAMARAAGWPLIGD